MFWITALIIICVISLLIFSQRFSTRKIGSFPLVQFVYLFFSAPLISTCLINIGFEIFNRPSLHSMMLVDTIILSLYITVVVIGALGAGIHSIAVTISHALLEHAHLEAYNISEFIHQDLSHEMLYINQMNVAFLLFLLELNHPLSTNLSIYSLVVLGIIFGIISAGAMVLGTFIRINLIIATILLGLASFLISTVISSPQQFPIAFAAYISLMTVVFILALTSVLLNYARGTARRCAVVVFPRGHKFRLELDCN